jgi:glycine/D-amino acid oxidase-like deaminating enzyme
MTFEYFWPGLIGVTQDLRPLAGFDENMKNVYYISAATGLPWAAALGRYSAERIVDKRDDLDIYFSPQRKFLFGNILQTILGKRITFPLANLYTLMK